LAGYDLVFSLEKDRWATDTLRYNNISNSIVEADITTLRSEEDVLELCNVSPDVIIGGPPCQGFSVAGPATKKDPKDPRNSLFRDFARWVGFLRPQIFVMENVKGILSRRNSEGEKVIDIIEHVFEDMGYRLDKWVLNASDYGVPQIRERVFIVGNSLDVTIDKPPVTHVSSRSNGNGHQPQIIHAHNLQQAVLIGDALLDLPIIEAGQGQEEQPYTDRPVTEYQVWARGDQKVVFNHVAMNHTDRIVERFRRIQAGGLLEQLPEELRVRQRNGNGALSEAEYHSNYRHLRSGETSFTIPASFYSSFIHPAQPRNITAREAARLQSFPDWYRFMGKRTMVSSKLLHRYGRQDEDYLSQYNQIGNAVPPLLSKAIAQRLADVLNN